MDESKTAGVINDAGIDEYESTVENPDVATENFPQQIYNIINSTFSGSQIQQGTSHSSQTVEINNNDLNQMKELLDTIDKIYHDNIKNTLNVVTQNVLNENLKNTKEEIKKEKPLYERLKEKINVLKGSFQLIAVTSSLVQDQILPSIRELLKYFKE